MLYIFSPHLNPCINVTKEILDDPSRSLAIDLFMKHPIETVKKLAVEKIKLVGADGKAK